MSEKVVTNRAHPAGETMNRADIVLRRGPAVWANLYQLNATSQTSHAFEASTLPCPTGACRQGYTLAPPSGEGRTSAEYLIFHAAIDAGRLIQTLSSPFSILLPVWFATDFGEPGGLFPRPFIFLSFFSLILIIGE